MRTIKLFLSLFIAGFFLLFVAQNSTLVEVSFFNYKGYTPTFVLVLASALMGFLVAFFYFLPREARLRSLENNLTSGVEKLNNGFFLKAEQNFQKTSSLEPLLCLSLYEREEANRLLDLNSPLSAHMLLKLHQWEQAEGKFKKILEVNPENLLALKGLRDISFLKKDIKQALEYQERVLRLCEKWDKDNQKRIMAELLVSADEVDRAFELYRTSLTYTARINSLLKLDKEKEAIKLFEKSFEEGLQDEILLMLEETSLTKLMDVIQKRWEQVNKIVLLLLYLRLGLLSKAKLLLDQVPEYYKCMALLYMSHREEDKRCAKALEEALLPWECVCGTRHGEYIPLCPNCLKWNKLKLKL
ncbi:lipopolysaccharide assembly protein LapA domain-containing protein [Thermocrinis sp.]